MLRVQTVQCSTTTTCRWDAVAFGSNVLHARCSRGKLKLQRRASKQGHECLDCLLQFVSSLGNQLSDCIENYTNFIQLCFDSHGHNMALGNWEATKTEDHNQCRYHKSMHAPEHLWGINMGRESNPQQDSSELQLHAASKTSGNPQTVLDLGSPRYPLVI